MEPRIADTNLVVGGIEGKNLDALARALVDDTPERRRQTDLRYVLEQALQILNVAAGDQRLTTEPRDPV
jgi:phage gp16-like protein